MHPASLFFNHEQQNTCMTYSQNLKILRYTDLQMTNSH